MIEKVLKERVVFKNRYGEPITFLVRKRVTELKKEEVPVVSVEEVERMIKQRPCKSCEYFVDWLKELKKEAKKNEKML